ncbi:MAG: DUF4476 domain-containing protein [Bacteroidales bacterium]|nr:DUF4476 domain-containing protein [Bacteroidales bacterium]
MKRLVIIAITILLTPCLMAQPGGRPHQHQSQPPHQSHQTSTPPPAPGQQHPHQQLHTLVLNANNGEEFVVYVDGDIVNRKAMSSVLVHNLNNQPHDIYVVLKRPVDKITVMRYFPDMIVENCMVSYNIQTRNLELTMMQPQAVPPQPNLPHICSYEEVEQMYNLLKKESFDDTRLSMAKNMVSHQHLAAHQIKRLAESFTFDSNKLAFLKYAYAYCVDQQNYYVCLEVLTFSSDKENLMRYINN